MLKVNKKKALRLQNRTNYFVPDKDKVVVRCSSPHSYQSRRMKIEGYEDRLYWQFKHCQDNDGQTFFYTLTYNDLSIPKMYGISCFDYEDLRDLLTGGFRKQLLRKYGSTFKYFVGAELGDGKGERGMHNNPHYHILLFVEPAPEDMLTFHYERYRVQVGVYQRNSKYGKKGDPIYKIKKRKIIHGYKKITDKEMTHLMRLYWQGFDEAETGFRDYNTAKYGIVKEGKEGAIVKDFRACAYCAKYVTKDVKLVQHEEKIEHLVRFQLHNEYRYKDEVYEAFFREVINPMFNTPLNPKKTEWAFSDARLINECFPYAAEWYEKVNGRPLADIRDTGFMPFVSLICDAENLWSDFETFVNKYVEPFVQDKLNEWRNRYSNKCRISQGVGADALDHIGDKMNPKIPVPSKKGIKYRPLSMYYYRKMFCDVVKDPKGNNLYVLNDLGQRYKVARLPIQIKKTISKVQDYIPILLDNRSLYESMRNSDVNTDVFWNHRAFSVHVKPLIQSVGLDEILKRYAEYKLVYQDRFFSLDVTRGDHDAAMPCINVLADYQRFLVPSFYSVPRNDLRLSAFLESIPENYLPYSQHPYFSRYTGVFAVLDLCSDYFFIQKDDKDQKQAEEIAATKRFHSDRELKDFYKPFKNM